MNKFIYSLVVITLILNVLYSQELNPGDGVRITFYNISDEISGDYFAQQDGNIQLPYIGLIAVVNRNFRDINTEIIAKYDSLYRNPELTVQPLFKINITGEVRTPGVYYVTGIEKMMDVIALAGGETSDADIDNIYIMRENEEITVDAEQIIKDGNKISDIGLKSGDRIFVPRQWWVSARNAGIIISGAALVVTIISVFFLR